MELTVLALSFIGLLVIGVPVAFAIGLASVCTILVAGLPVAVAGDLMQSHRDDDRRMSAGVFALSGRDATGLIGA